MLSTIASSVVALLLEFLPLASTSSTVTAILNTLIQIIPVVVQEATDLIEPVKNIIAALSANPAATSDQLATLATLDAQCDAAFEAAAVAAGAAPQA